MSNRTSSPSDYPWSGLRTQVTPSPDGSPLKVRIRCWTSKAPRAPFKRHAATISPDWTVDVPHDLAAERLAQAFGGWLSCLELETTALAAARRWLELTLRAVPPPLRPSNGSGTWRVYPEQSCCSTKGYDRITDAFEHARDLNHLCKPFLADPKQLRDLVNAIGAAHGVDKAAPLPLDLADQAAEGLTHGRDDVTWLWYAGVHPQAVLKIRDRLNLDGRLPTSFYLAVLTRKPDLDWMRTTLERAGAEIEPSTVTPGGVVLDASGLMSMPEWLAWTAADWDRADPTARSRWLELGISRQVLLSLAGHGYSPADIEALAAGIGRSPDGAARYLVEWLICDARPTIADLVDLHRSGRTPLWHAPSAVALLRVIEILGAGRYIKPTVDRSQVALLLAVCGNVPDTVTAYRAGRTWRDEPFPEESTA